MVSPAQMARTETKDLMVDLARLDKPVVLEKMEQQLQLEKRYGTHQAENKN